MNDISKVVDRGVGNCKFGTKIKEKFPAVTAIAVDLLDRSEIVPIYVE